MATANPDGENARERRRTVTTEAAFQRTRAIEARALAERAMQRAEANGRRTRAILRRVSNRPGG